MWIGFQAKFFDVDIKYTKIKESADKIVEYYTGKAGKVDLVYLFCNKPITSTAKTFVKTVNLLKKHNMIWSPKVENSRLGDKTRFCSLTIEYSL